LEGVLPHEPLDDLMTLPWDVLTNPDGMLSFFIDSDRILYENVEVDLEDG
jgi:hypothetical protein